MLPYWVCPSPLLAVIGKALVLVVIDGYDKCTAAMKTYRGLPLLRATMSRPDRGRADDITSPEGAGVAERYTASPGVPVRPTRAAFGRRLRGVGGGARSDTGAPKGRLRNDDQAVRFRRGRGQRSKILVAQPPNCTPISVPAYEPLRTLRAGPRDDANHRLVGRRHATHARGPPRRSGAGSGDRESGLTVRHLHLAPGDPHRHLHLQINAQGVRPNKDSGRGLHSVGGGETPWTPSTASAHAA
jgi:hypothetical protein